MGPGPLQTLALLAAVHLLSAISPGPNVLLVIRSAARERRLGFLAAAGLLPAGLLWAVAGLTGTGALLRAAPRAALALQVGCGAYLCWLGLSMLRDSLRGARARAEPPPPAASIVRVAFVTNLTNPKSLAYFTSVFTATGVVHLPVRWQVAAVLMLPLLSLGWYSSLALAASSAAAGQLLRERLHWLDRVAGVAMIGFGVRLLAGG
ncbi:MAG: LysE family translocator [Deltaproteobacteria bacterium]|nr:LysE family translocator [Deltaproteobacteria bacterium]